MLIHSVMVAHIAEAIEVYHKGNRGDDNEHHRRNRVKQEAESDYKGVGELQPCYIEYSKLEAFASLSYKLGCSAEEVCECGDVRQHQHSAHSKGAESSRESVAHFHAGETEQQEHEQRNDQYQKR